MSIEQAIHVRWEASTALSALVPAERLMTGEHWGEPALPYAVLVRGSAEPLARTSSGTELRRTRVRVAVYSADLETGQAALRAIRAEFDRQVLEEAGEAAMNMQWVEERQRLESQGVWRVTVDYDVDTSLGPVES